MARKIKDAILKSGKARLAGPGFAAALLALLLLTTGVASAQPEIEWSLTLGGDEDDFAHAAIQTSDGGYVVVGETGSLGAGGQDVWLVKLDSDGNEQWAQTFGGPLDDIGYDVQQTAEGGYIVAGETHSFSSGGAGSASNSDYWLIKTDALGQHEWNQTYGNIELRGARDLTTADIAHGVRQTSDSGYIVAGSSQDSISQDIWLVKTGPLGQTQWEGQFGGDLDDKAFGVLETVDGGYIAAGKTDSFGAGGSDYWLIKTDSTGAELWTKTFGGEYNDEARAVVQTADGGYALGGFSWSFGAGLSDFWLVKTDESGDEEWNRSYGSVPRDAAHSLQQTEDGGYVLAGWSESFPGGDRFWVVKAGPFGNKQWDKTYGGSSGARAVQQAADGGYVVAGWKGPLEGVRDIWVVKTLAEDPAGAGPSGPVGVLENAGPAHITSAAVAFNVPGSAAPHHFYYRGRLLNTENPLPPGFLACTLPLPGVISGSHIVSDQLNSFGNGFIDPITTLLSTPEVVIDAVAGIPFDLSHGGVQGGRMAGSYSFVSQSPCDEARPAPGPAAPTGLTVTVSTDEPATLDLDWNDNPEGRIAGYRVHVSLKRTGPYGPIAALATDSEYSDRSLSERVTYYYTVTAVDNQGVESLQSEVASGVQSDSIPPQAPSGLRLVFSDQEAGTAVLDWSDNTDTDLQGYRVFRRDGDGPLAQIAIVGTRSAFTDQTLLPEGSFTYLLTALDQAGNESGQSNIAPPDLDFFGTVIGIELDQRGGGLLVINTSSGNVEAYVVRQTSIQLPQETDASIADLARGDNVAVALVRRLSRLVADKVFLIPGKTVNRHLSGYVSELSPGEITIQPTNQDQPPVKFQLSPSVEIKFHQGITELTTGAYVIVSAVSVRGTGEISSLASEINVTTGRVPDQDGRPTRDPTVLAKLNGIFQRIDPSNGNLILSGTAVALDAATQMAQGLVAGDAVEVEAELRPDGSLVARRVERDSGTEEIAEQTILEGLFHGIAEISGQWLVGGTSVTVDHRTHTDGLPRLRQRIKVKALLQTDGSLLAREIENQTAPELRGGLGEVTLLEGPFSGTDDDGNWIVGGLPVAVDSVTGLEGSPSVGRRVAVDAIVRNGRLVARNVSAIQRDEDVTVREVRIRGTVDRVLANGTVVVDGVRVTLSNLTELATEAIAGEAVEIKALLQSNGTLVARVIDAAPPEDETRETRANPVDIEGEIQRVNNDGSLIVNGIRVVISGLSDIEGDTQPGATVQIRGILQRSGSVLAREVRGQGRLAEGETEAKVEGVVEEVFLDADGVARSFVIDGVTVVIEDLTTSEVALAPGTPVVVQAVVKDGLFLAVNVKAKPSGVATRSPEVELQGTIESLERDATGRVVRVFINGIEVEVGAPHSVIRGELEIGQAINIKGVIRDGGLVAGEVETDSDPSEDRPSKFKLEGEIEEVRQDSDGTIVGLTVDGERIDVEALTLIEGVLVSGNRVVVEGIVRNGALLAASIVEDTLDDGLSTGEVESKR